MHMINTSCLKYLSKEHNKNDFFCEEENLNIFLKKYARQKHEQNLSKTYVWPDDHNNVMAYITIAYDTVDLSGLNEVPNELGRSAKESIPVIYLLMLARDKTYKGKKTGRILLLEAIKMTYNASKIAGIKGLFLTAANEEVAEKFYDKIEFLKKISQIIDNENKPKIVYYIPIKQIEAIVLDLQKQTNMQK